MNPLTRLSVYLNNVSPLQLHVLDFRYLLYRKPQVLARIRETLIPSSLKIEDITLRKRDGGAIVTLSTEVSEQETLDIVNKHLAQSPPEFHNFKRNKAFLIRGSPFLADFAGKLPTREVSVEIPNVEYNASVPIESLYDLLRPYGRIYDISVPVPVKDTPRNAIVKFINARSAAAAHNCVYGTKIFFNSHSSPIRVNYGKRRKILKMLTDYVFSHPRIFIPAFFAALLAGSYVLFDPLRQKLIAYKTTNFDVSWFSKLKHRLFRAEKKEELNLGMWEGHAEIEQQIKQWLVEPPSGFILLSGPNGSGKSDLVHRVLKERKYRVWIDCEALCQARNEQDLLRRLAAQVGYAPVFTFLMSLSSLTEALVLSINNNY